MRLTSIPALVLLGLTSCGDPIGEGACIGVTTNNDFTNGCLTTFTRCSDAHDYQIACTPDGSCKCKADDKVVSSTKVTECPTDFKTVDSACGWSLTNQ